MRQIVTDFVTTGPPELIEFLYSSEKKQYSADMVNPKVSQLFKFIEMALAVLKSENADTAFMQAMMDLAITILLAVSSLEFISFFDNSWIYKFVRVVRRVRECKVKE